MTVENEAPKEKLAYLYEPADIDATSIEMLSDLPELFAFQVILTGTPDPVWIRTFDRVWKESRYLNKLAACIKEERIRFICRQSQGIADYVFLIESRIRKTNELMSSYWERRGWSVKRIEHRPYPDSFRPIGVF